MSFQGLQAKYNRLHGENAAWKLLRADNAPYILAFISDLFAEESEVPFGRARIRLDAEIDRLRELGIWQTETAANTYLNQWIASGWLRELDDSLTKTDASETALRFCRSLDERTAGTTASHLRIVQEAVRDLAVAISPNVDERITLLEHKKAELEREITDLRAGIVKELSEQQQRERIREVYQLASVLTGDFRRVEDEIRQLDKALRIQLIEGGATRGEVLLSVMEKEALLSSTDAGSAFEGFFQLLCDQNRQTELRDQLNGILNQPIAQQLSQSQQQFLAHLMRELGRESDRVFQVRRRTEESLRAYVESGAASENRAVDQLLSRLEKVAVALRDGGTNLRTETTLSLPVGPLELTSPETMRLRSPDEKLDTRGVKARENAREPSKHILDSLETVRVREVAEKTFRALAANGPMTIAGLLRHHPVNAGLEELVAYVRVAKSVKAAQLEDMERVELADKSGARFRATVPTFVLSAELFPPNLNELLL
ncbi:DUF3375 domain-containing protein [Marinobacter koreensis]|uniref:DUF3375 domain-containing protein n=1 Tax=Marinobacter koreensis TaxID=335974 RepID=A0ABW0RQJ4_9GAMM|nr:DUF3375 domain-containing protein [Marinobacter koreensis]MCK7549372.1 DUF3375 domain-containing protein [Marinobacter koreensis]